MKKLIAGAALASLLTIGAGVESNAVYAAAPAPKGLVTLFKSKPFVATSTKEDHFAGNVSLKDGQDQLPLTLVVHNGGAGKVAFNWFRINVAGYLLASEKDLAGRDQGSIDVSGRIQPGGGQVLIDAAGEPGATLSFSLFSSPVSLRSVQPASIEPGQALILRGSGFSPNESQDVVYVGSTAVPVESASATSISVMVPAVMAQGKTTVRVVVNGLQTQSLPLEISNAPAPTLLSMNYWMAPPGAQLVITGKNFAANAADNKVFFKDVQGQIVSAGTTSITVIVPNWSFGPQQLNIPLSVTSNGVRSGNVLRFDFGPKYEGQLPPFPGDSSSQATP